MVADGKSEQLPIFAAPSGRNAEAKKEVARGFLRRLAGIRVANAMQASRSQQNPVKSCVAESGGGVRALEGVEKSNGDAGNLRSAAHMRINGAGRGAQAGPRNGLAADVRRRRAASAAPVADFAHRHWTFGSTAR